MEAIARNIILFTADYATVIYVSVSQWLLLFCTVVIAQCSRKIRNKRVSTPPPTELAVTRSLSDAPQAAVLSVLSRPAARWKSRKPPQRRARHCSLHSQEDVRDTCPFLLSCTHTPVCPTRTKGAHKLQLSGVPGSLSFPLINTCPWKLLRFPIGGAAAAFARHGEVCPSGLKAAHGDCGGRRNWSGGSATKY